MKFRTVALAAVATLACSMSQAALFGEKFDPAKFTLNEDSAGVTTGTYNGNPVGRVLVLSGASASAKFLGTFIIEDNCDKATLSVMWDSATGSNYRAYACDAKASSVIFGTTPDSLVVIKRDTGGSIQGVTPIYVPARISMMRVGALSSNFNNVATTQPNTCVAVGSGTASLNVPNYRCPTASDTLFPDAGFSDVEANIMFSGINGGTALTATGGAVTQNSVFQQIFGVATNLKLYRALQASQGLTQDDNPANRPSLPSTFVASALSGKLSTSATGKRGWGFVISSSVDANAATKQMNICRRAAGSGTQAGANIQFQLNPCSTSGKQLPLTAQGAIAETGTTTAVVEASSGGNLETCLTNIDNLAGSAYGIGHLTRDNDPFAAGGDKKYRFVKLDGAQPEAHPDAVTGLCAPGVSCQDAQNGKYPYVFESTMLWNSGTPGNADKVAALRNIQTKAFLPATIAGNDASIIAGAMALPSSYSGAFESLALGSAAQVYGSRVTRGTSSCAPLSLAK